MNALSVVATLERAELVDDGLEVVPVWESVVSVSGTLTPAGLEVTARLGLRPDEVTHTLILGRGLPLAPADWRVIVGGRTFEVVRVTSLPTHCVLLLRLEGGAGVPDERPSGS